MSPARCLVDERPDHLGRSWVTLARPIFAWLLCIHLLSCAPPPAQAPSPADPVVFKQPKSKPRVKAKKARHKRDAEHHAALQAMIDARFSTRSDKDEQARFPLPDRNNWTRVRFSMIDHFTGFIYGEDEHSMTVAVIVPLREEDPATSAACVQRFEESARSQVTEMGGRLSATSTIMRKWHGKPLVVRTAEGEVDVLFKHYSAALAWAGYPAYPGSCMVYVVVIPWRDDSELAFRLREQWFDAFRKFRPLTESVPFRH